MRPRAEAKAHAIDVVLAARRLFALSAALALSAGPSGLRPQGRRRARDVVREGRRLGLGGRQGVEERLDERLGRVEPVGRREVLGEDVPRGRRVWVRVRMTLERMGAIVCGPVDVEVRVGAEGLWRSDADAERRWRVRPRVLIELARDLCAEEVVREDTRDGPEDLALPQRGRDVLLLAAHMLDLDADLERRVRLALPEQVAPLDLALPDVLREVEVDRAEARVRRGVRVARDDALADGQLERGREERGALAVDVHREDDVDAVVPPDVVVLELLPRRRAARVGLRGGCGSGCVRAERGLRARHRACWGARGGHGERCGDGHGRAVRGRSEVLAVCVRAVRRGVAAVVGGDGVGPFVVAAVVPVRIVVLHEHVLCLFREGINLVRGLI